MNIIYKDNTLLISIENQLELDKQLLNEAKDLLSETNPSKVLIAEFYEMCLRRHIIKTLNNSNIDIKTDTSHIVTFNINDATYRFNVVKFDNSLLGSGYNISKSILI